MLRHRTRDLDLINEIAGHLHAYEPPSGLARELTGPLRILDLGANIGMFGAFALGRFDVRELCSVEPDPANAALLRATIAANHAQARWRMVQAAVATSPGTMAFLGGRLAESRAANPGEPAIEVPTVDLFALDHAVDLIKLDIEGGEWPILVDPRMAELGARILVMEWHWRGAPAPDPHGEALRRLQAAGFEVCHDEIAETVAGIGLVWARRRRATVSGR